ncbi:hypothetical protein [Kurthia sp. Dielmo]|uniref:hypothetical protein n=1 Tax=Kurthia sp. Dielmo TaxID=1033738 RepID=UPI001120E844|nr:hypothetical protein [Kurthia sp. Dielmo]
MKIGPTGSDLGDSILAAFSSGGFRENILNSNKAIQNVHAGGMLGGISQSVNAYRDTGDLARSIKAAHSNEDGALNYGRIAGSVLTAGVGYRALSGGGLYRDKDGQTNIAGVPFI